MAQSTGQATPTCPRRSPFLIAHRRHAQEMPPIRTRPAAAAAPKIGVFVQKIIRPLHRKQGWTEAQLRSHWPHVVGAALARHTRPAGMSFPRGRQGAATLTIEVAGPLAVEIQHQTPQIIERINTALGRRAVERIRCVPFGHAPRRIRNRGPAGPKST